MSTDGFNMELACFTPGDRPSRQKSLKCFTILIFQQETNVIKVCFNVEPLLSMPWQNGSGFRKYRKSESVTISLKWYILILETTLKSLNFLKVEW